MLIKLIKYDLIASGKTFLMMYATIVFITVTHLLTRASELLHLFGVILYTAVVIFAFLSTIFIIFSRFNKSVFSNEGYLTNTLPVKPSTLVLSKLISSFVWFFATYFVIIVTFVVFFNAVDFSSLPLFGIELNTFIFYAIVSSIVTSSLSILLFFFSISVGQMVNSRRKLLSFLTFFGLSTFSSIFSSIRNKIYESLGMVTVNLSDISFSDFSASIPYQTSELIIATIFCIILFFGTTLIIKKRLNLE